MKINEFIKGFENAKDKENYVRGHVVHSYVDYETKIAICKSIVKSSMYKEVNGKKMFVIDSPMRYMFFVLAIISSYTDIELLDDGMNRMKVFNSLEKHDVISVIANVMRREYTSFSSILNVMVEDEIKNNDLRSLLDTKIEALSLVASQIPWEKIINESTINNKAK